jgi:hypothetical protein
VSTIIAVLSLTVMLLMSASFIVAAIRERKRYVSTGRTQQLIPFTQFQSQPSSLLHPQHTMEIPAEQPGDQTTFGLPRSWYTRRRMLVSLGLLLMVMLTLSVQSGLADGALENVGKSLDLLSNSFNASDLNTAAHLNQSNASQQLVRISQLDPNQYASADEYNTWAYSACSAAAMTEVFNAYGHQYRITDILNREAKIGEITPSLGLLRPEGIKNTAAQFGFQTTWGNAWTLDRVIETANHGNPVIVDFPPDRYDGGHLLVVTGGNMSTVFLADSSLWNRHSLSRGQFLQWWVGFAAVVTPKS